MIRCNLLNAVWISSLELCMITSLGMSFVYLFIYFRMSCLLVVVEIISVVYNREGGRGRAPCG